MKLKFFVILLVFFFINCKKEIPHEAKFLVLNCFQCHYPESSPATAPSFPEIDSHYRSVSSSKEEYIQKMIEFIQDPKVEKTLDPAWVQRYGLMPKFSYSEDFLSKVVSYIYETDFNSHEWKKLYEKILKEKSKQDQAQKPFAEEGLEIAMQAKAELGKNLLKAIQEKGTTEAVEFCNLNALSITNQIAQNLGVSLRRVSDKPRNPKNEANPEEKQIIEIFKIQLRAKQKLKPITRELENIKVGYFAIETNQTCLQCHGIPKKDIQVETLEKINSLYPQDKAIGYTENEIRGLWVVEKTESFSP